jgi:hypothetical protein
MKPDIEKKLEQLAENIGTRDSFVNDVMDRIESSPVQPGKKTAKPNIVLRRILMKNTLKFTAAAVILIAATLSLTLFDKTVPTAYALEQTIEALNAMRSIHARIYYPINPEPALLWAEFHDNGQAKRLRASQPAFDPHDGPKEVVWEDNTARIWSKKTNTLYYIRGHEGVEKVSRLFWNLDPKLLVQKLKAMQNDGTAQLAIEQPDDISEPIVITVTLTEEDSYLGQQAVALVDQATKFVISLETQKNVQKNGHFDMEDFSRIEFFDYNQSFEDDIFVLNVPDNVMVIDQATNIVGLSQGDMSIEETAIEVVRLFWASLIEKDYETAGLMYGGIPAKKIQEALETQSEGNILKVVSIGTVKIHPNPDYKNKAFIVPCTLEYAEGGQVKQKVYSCTVREVDGQAGRWAICGGI